MSGNSLDPANCILQECRCKPAFLKTNVNGEAHEHNHTNRVIRHLPLAIRCGAVSRFTSPCRERIVANLIVVLVQKVSLDDIALPAAQSVALDLCRHRLDVAIKVGRLMRGSQLFDDELERHYRLSASGGLDSNRFSFDRTRGGSSSAFARAFHCVSDRE